MEIRYFRQVLLSRYTCERYRSEKVIRTRDSGLEPINFVLPFIFGYEIEKPDVGLFFFFHTKD